MQDSSSYKPSIPLSSSSPSSILSSSSKSSSSLWQFAKKNNIVPLSRSTSFPAKVSFGGVGAGTSALLPTVAPATLRLALQARRRRGGWMKEEDREEEEGRRRQKQQEGKGRNGGKWKKGNSPVETFLLLVLSLPLLPRSLQQRQSWSGLECLHVRLRRSLPSNPFYCPSPPSPSHTGVSPSSSPPPSPIPPFPLLYSSFPARSDVGRKGEG